MEERHQTISSGDEINLGEYFAILRPHWWKIALLSLAAGIVALIVMFQLPNIYKATAVITPAIDEKKQNPTLGALASFGIEIGGPTKVEDLESLFKSNDLIVRVFRRYNLWGTVLPDRFDSKSGNLNIGLIDRLFRGEKGSRPPGDWDAIRAAEDRLKVSVSKKAGTVSLSFESPSAGDRPAS
jgi:uncharacterized protein involved in exopolysaccharide biosynthesis